MALLRPARLPACRLTHERLAAQDTRLDADCAYSVLIMREAIPYCKSILRIGGPAAAMARSL